MWEPSSISLLLNYHPQTDGQSEIVNSTILDLLKCYVNDVDQRNQSKRYLPLVEYAYNNTIHASTGKTPFEIVEGYPKIPPILRTKEKIFVADEYVCDVQEAFTKVKEALKRAQIRQKEAQISIVVILNLKKMIGCCLNFQKLALSTKVAKIGKDIQRFIKSFMPSWPTGINPSKFSKR